MTIDWTTPILSSPGRCDPFGNLDPTGDYVRVVYCERHNLNDHEHGATHGIALTTDAAERLIWELQAALAQKPKCDHHWLLAADPKEITCPKCNITMPNTGRRQGLG